LSNISNIVFQKHIRKSIYKIPVTFSTPKSIAFNIFKHNETRDKHYKFELCSKMTKFIELENGFLFVNLGYKINYQLSISVIYPAR